MAISDALTWQRLRAVGVTTGWRCLEIGAADGPVGRWLAQRVGPTGSVCATEFEMYAGTVERGTYDLVHCGSGLMRVQDPEQALARLAEALRPDGCLVVETHDYSSFAAVPGASRRRATRWNRAAANVLSVARAHSVFAPDLGRRLPGLVAETGLRIVAAEGRTAVRHGRDHVARSRGQSLRQLAALPAFAGSTAEIDILLAGLDDPTFAFVDATNFGVSAVSLGSARCP